ncbi:MAG: hypothetical protein CL868_14980 [Cytophagaceae bacterium]|nr:hypothetical protein [Cytophagaceae bacterium]|tara:strand:+ start:4851 stop:5705 length:855 start_codon:yes stop_codon:yes gene_type:complete
MDFNILYKPLFKVNIYHRYFLDDGETAFDVDNATLQKQLRLYDKKEFLTVIPSIRTHKLLKGNRMQLHQLKDGFTVTLQVEKVGTGPDTFRPSIDLRDDIILDFLLKVTDPLFENYSEANPMSSIPYYLSNHRPSTEVPAGFNYINKNHDSQYVTSFSLSEPGFNLVKENLDPVEAKNNIGIISLRMKGDNATHNITLVNGNLPQSLPVFKVLFNNRKTFWRYYKGTATSPSYTTDPQLKPLVKNGTVTIQDGDMDYPAATARSIVFEKDSGGNIVKTFSEIYI